MKTYFRNNFAFTLAEGKAALRPRRYKSAFTLAEILITLGIIGIVAALTLPSLIQKQNERATVAKYKKMYSTLVNAHNSAVAENGSPKDWQISNALDLLKIYEPYLKVAETCYNKKGCVYSGDFVSLDGQARWGNVNNDKHVKLRLSDGTALWSVSGYAGCSHGYEYVGKDGNTYTVADNISCGLIYGIIDNSKNGKNRLGVGHFAFIVTKDGLYPYMWDSNDNTILSNCSLNNPTAGTDKISNTQGETCGAWILKYDNMDYWYKK